MRQDAVPKRYNARFTAQLRQQVRAAAVARGLTTAQLLRELAILGIGGTVAEAQAENEAMEIRREMAREMVAGYHPEVEFGRHPITARSPDAAGDYAQLGCRFTAPSSRRLLEWGKSQGLPPNVAFRQAVLTALTYADAYRHQTF
jgi:hypothetical protein